MRPGAPASPARSGNLASTLIACFACALASMLAGCSTTRPRPHTRASDQAALALFDGQTLNGWIVRGGTASFTVEDGCIVGRTAPNQPNTFLCTEADYTDFILTLEFLIDPRLNSGIQIRSASHPDHQGGRVHGYQVEIDPSPRSWTGGIYDESRRGWIADLSNNPEARAAFRQNEWNTMRIEAIDDRIRTWVNGVPASDLRDSMSPAGFIALQVHGVGPRVEPLEVRWRVILLAPVHRPQPTAHFNASQSGH